MAIDGFRGDPNQMRSVVQEMVSAGDAFERALDNLEQQIYPTLQGWEGESANTYIECQRNWDALAKELREFLAKAALGVEGVADAYERQDKYAAGNFGG
ncbi:WXG100 family type VII secretion target [Streptomyces sp. NPDC048629]|uniref:WXG100 family type VII secretion target n=1 Tax=Streptomyces sp. NPDC048629 TaxID=3154824 RepID=UPI00343072EF